jgi:hypothetical protein
VEANQLLSQGFKGQQGVSLYIFENETTGEFEEKYLKIDSSDVFKK